jgi:SAM-dependent methyltransferase
MLSSFVLRARFAEGTLLESIRPDARSPEQVREHYLVERDLATRLRDAPASRRLGLYSEAHHPLLTQKLSSQEKAASVDRQLGWLRSFLKPEHVFLEVGAGDCLVTMAAAALVQRAIAVEVSQTIAASSSQPPNFQLILSDGVSIPVPNDTVDVIYSQQLMEHLHPEDAFAQLRNVYAALKPGGVYVCVTPNALTGPHDISRFYDAKATGLHLHEYTIGELETIFRQVGFKHVSLVALRGGSVRRIPTAPFRAIEQLLAPLPRRARIALARHVRPRVLFSYRLAAVK